MSYTPTNWTNGDIITTEKLNKIENGIVAASSSIGVLVVNLTTDPDTLQHTCDKTAGEIMAVADVGGIVVFKSTDEYEHYINYMTDASYNNGIGYTFSIRDGRYFAASTNDYPVSVIEK